MLVTNRPEITHCGRGGIYKNKPGEVLQIYEGEDLVSVSFSNIGRWICPVDELICIDDQKLLSLPSKKLKDGQNVAMNNEVCQIKYFVGDWVRLQEFNNRSSIIWGRVSDIVPIDMEEVPAEFTPASLPPGNQPHCSMCGYINKSTYFTPSGKVLCLDCANKLSVCSHCFEVTRLGYTLNEVCRECGVELLPRWQSEGRQFKLDCSMWLPKEAANFYLLYLLKLETGWDCGFSELCAKLADEFSRYMFLAIGGELRHAGLRHVKEPERNKEVFVWFQEANFEIRARDSMWQAWQDASKTLGKESMLEFAIDLFNQNGGEDNEETNLWEDGCGGHNWAVISQTLLSYLKGDYTKTIFVDTAFGLEHNNDIHLSKVWLTDGLRNILDANANGNYRALLLLASEEVKEDVKCLNLENLA